MNFAQQTTRRTKVFAASTEVSGVHPSFPPVSPVVSPRHPSPRAGAVTAVHAAFPLFAQPTFPALSIEVRPRLHAPRAGAVSASKAAYQPAFPASPVEVRPRVQQPRPGGAQSSHTALPTAATNLAIPSALARSVVARPLPTPASRTSAATSLLPPPAASVATKIGVIPAARSRRDASPRPVVDRSWSNDLAARPHPPTVMTARTRVLAARSVSGRCATPPEAPRQEAATPVAVKARRSHGPAGTHATRRTPLVNGTLGLSPTAGVTVKGRPVAARPIHPAVAGTSPAAQTTASRAIVASSAKPQAKAAGVTTGRTGTVPEPPTRPSITVAARPLAKSRGASATTAASPLVTRPPKPGVALVPAGNATARSAPAIVKVDTLRVAATSIQTPRPKPAAVAPKVLATPAGRVRKTSLPAGPQPVPVAKVARGGIAPPLAAPIGLSLTTTAIHEVAPTRATITPARPLPLTSGRSATDRTWAASPLAHGPMPRVIVARAGRWPQPRSGRALHTSSIAAWIGSNTTGTGAINGLPPDLPAAVVQWLRLYPGVASAFGEVLPATPKLFGDWNLGNTSMPYLVYQEVMEGNYGFQSIDAWGQTLAFPQGQFQISVFSTGKRAGRILAEQVAAALNDAPLTFGDGVLLEMRLQSIHAIPEGAIGTNGSASSYHFAMVFLYRVQRNLTFTGN